MPSTETPGGMCAEHYVPNSRNLVNTITTPAPVVTNTWFPNRDELGIKKNSVGTVTVSQYDYGVNNLSQRTDMATSGTARLGKPPCPTSR